MSFATPMMLDINYPCDYTRRELFFSIAPTRVYSNAETMGTVKRRQQLKAAVSHLIARV